MTHVIDGLKLNKFKEVHLLDGADLFARVGSREVISRPSSIDEPLPMHLNKIDSYTYIDDYDKMMQKEEYLRAKKEYEDSLKADESAMKQTESE